MQFRISFAAKQFLMLSFISAALAAGCKVRQQNDSRVKVVNGKALKETDFPAVIQIAYDLGGGASATCSATWVSDRTVLTAAHCVEGADQSPSKVTIVRGTGKSLRASKVYSHPTYRPNSGIGHDIAIIVFSEQSSTFYIPVALTQAQAGDPLTIIGFGKFDHLNSKSGGTKRMGTNQVADIDYQGRVDFEGLISPINTEGTGESVTNSQGDSGGPMIIKGRVQGVSSSVSKGSGAKNRGHYESVRAPAIEDWLKKLARNGTYILGFSEGTESISATDPTILGNDAGDVQPSTPPASPGEVPPPAPQVDPEIPPPAPTPSPSDNSPIPAPSPTPTPTPNPAPQPQSILDCNKDYSIIRRGGQGICMNRSSGFCYRYSSADVQYSMGRVSCPSGFINPPSTNPAPVPQPPVTSLDCNTDYRTIRAGGTGVCLNRSSGFCYRYSGGSVQYSQGRVSCP